MGNLHALQSGAVKTVVPMCLVKRNTCEDGQDAQNASVCWPNDIARYSAQAWAKYDINIGGSGPKFKVVVPVKDAL